MREDASVHYSSPAQSNSSGYDNGQGQGNSSYGGNNPNQGNQPSYNSNQNQGSQSSYDGGQKQANSGYHQDATQKFGGKPKYDGKKWDGAKSHRTPIPTVPYFPIGIVSTSDHPLEGPPAECFAGILQDLHGRGFTLRYQAGTLNEGLIPSNMETETYLPFSGFDDVEGDKLIFASKANKELFANIHPKGSDLTKGNISMNGANMAIMMGVFNTSPVRALLVLSPDGAVTAAECGRETGYISPFIKMAGILGIPVVNLNDHSSARQALGKALQYIN